MKRVSDRGSQEAHNESQLLSSDLPFQLQVGSSFWCQDTSVLYSESAGWSPRTWSHLHLLKSYK